MKEVYKKAQRDSNFMAYFLLFTIYMNLFFSYMDKDNFFILLAGLLTLQLVLVNKMQKNNKKKLQETYLRELLGKY